LLFPASNFMARVPQRELGFSERVTLP